MSNLPSMTLRSLAGFASLALALSACNQAAQTASPDASTPPAVHAPQSTEAPVRLSPDEGKPLQGKELEAFLKTLPDAKAAQPAEAPQAQPGPLAKTAYNACTINFNSSTGISNMADKAYTYYATAPWYYQYCAPADVYVVPSNYNNYYLIPEAANVCPGSYGKMGYGTVGNCQSQQSAALFPRYAGIATSTDGTVGIMVYMQNNRNFKFSSYYGKGGNIKVYANRVGIGWWQWGPLSANTTWTFSNADNVTQVVFHSANMYDPFYFDDVVVTPW